MATIPQLFMRKTNMDQLPPLSLPAGFSLSTHTEGMEPVWEKLIAEAFGKPYSFERVILNGGGYKQEYVLYLSNQGTVIATATAVEKQDFPGEGWFRMIAASPAARGLGAGRLVCLAALH